MSADLRLLLIEDSAEDASLVVHALTRGGFTGHPTRVDSHDALLTALSSGT